MGKAVNTDMLVIATLMAQELQEFCDDAQIAAGDPDGTGELLATRQLIDDWERAYAEKYGWQAVETLQRILGRDSDAATPEIAALRAKP